MLMEGGTLRQVESEEELRHIGAVDDDLEGIDEEEPSRASEGGAHVLGGNSEAERSSAGAELGGGGMQNGGVENVHLEREGGTVGTREGDDPGGGSVSLDLAGVGGVDENAEAEALALTSAGGAAGAGMQTGAVMGEIRKVQNGDGSTKGVGEKGAADGKEQQTGVKPGLRTGQTVVKEDRVEGVVTKETLKSYINAGGGYIMFATVMIVFLIAQVRLTIPACRARVA